MIDDTVHATVPVQRASGRLAAVSRFLRAAAAVVLLAGAVPALAQFQLEATMSIAPYQVAAGVYTDVNIFIEAGEINVRNVAFTGALPTGVEVQPGYTTSQCGGTFSATATTFKLTGAAPTDFNDACNISFSVTSRPAVATDYTLDTGSIAFTYGTTGSTSISGTSADFRVLGGVPPQFSDSALYDGSVGYPYYGYVQFAQGTEPITITATGLPPGLSVTPGTHDIEGVPTTVGTYLATVTAKNGFAPDAVTSFTIRILPPTVSATKSFLPATVITGGTSTMTIRLFSKEYVIYQVGLTDDFPAGMTATPASFAACGGTVTVTANRLTLANGELYSGYEDGRTVYCDIVVDVKGTATSTRNLVNNTGPIAYGDEPPVAVPGASGTLRVLADAPKITSPKPHNGVVGLNYLHSVTVTGNSPIAITVSGLPPGLTYNSTTRTIAGVPTKPGSYPGTITASNGIDPDAKQNFTIIVTAPPLAITTESLPPITGGGYVNVPIQAVGGIPPYTFVLVSGDLPPGLSFAPTGVLAGTPTLPGSYTFTAQVTDSLGTKATRAYTIVIAKSVPGFAFEVLPEPAVAGQPVVITAALTGGAGEASGPVQVWVAHSYERCPSVPGDAPVATNSATQSLGPNGEVTFTFASLTIDNYTVCGTYTGDVRYKSATAGPVDLFVIKGALLALPAVQLSTPMLAKVASAIPASVTVRPPVDTDRQPQGKVMLRANGVPVATVALVNGVATFSALAPSVPGKVVFTASYYGDAGYAPATSSQRSVTVRATLDEVQPVPTLSQLALALLMAALGLAGARAVARQRRR